MTDQRKILTLREISERTRLPVSTHRWMRQRGEGPPTWKLGRHVVAYEDDVENWIRDQRRTSSAKGRSL